MKITGLKAMIYNRLHRGGAIPPRKSTGTPRPRNSRAMQSPCGKTTVLNQLYHSELLEVFDRFLPDVRQKLFLDLGCGTGRITRYLATRGAQVTGIDFSPKAVEIARRNRLTEMSCSVFNDVGYRGR